MKRILFIIGAILLFAAPIFSQTEEENGNNDKDEENIVRKEDDVYKMNGKGDQFIKIGIMPNFPMNFGDSLYIGGVAQLGYYRFLTGWFGLGAELMAGYNPTLGSNVLTFVPITLGAMFQPSVWKFEFPIFLSAGMAFETCSNKKYFPGFAGKVETGVFYRITEGWSAGITGQWLYLGEWYTDTDNADSDYGSFTQVSISARYHF
ncbi:MAG: hypothetical protein II098_10595 [Treponema sp.]|jgi:hypothetical protein|nr:hypothetical protein [Treponema sp.]